MLGQIWRQFRGLRPPVKSLVFLFWIYSLTTSLTSVFIQLFLFQEFSSVALNALATVLFDTGIVIGFAGFGMVAGWRRYNIKYGFLWSFLLMGVTLVALLNSTTPVLAYLAMSINGVGNGFFWLTIHTFELDQTNNEERDFYSSLLSAGTVVFAVLGPALATLLLFLSGTLFHLGDFTLLFLVTPAFYLLGFFCFSSIATYRPHAVAWTDVGHFFSERRNLVAQLYLMGTALQDIFSTVVIPLVGLFLLGSALKVGAYATGVALFSMCCVLTLSQYRTIQNRLPILALSALVLAAATAAFGSVFTFAALVLYSVVAGVSWPVLRVSIHVTDLETMESIGRPGADFYATMILREISLWVWRSLGGLVFMLFALAWPLEQRILPIGLYFYASSLLVVIVGATVLIRSMRHGRAASK